MSERQPQPNGVVNYEARRLDAGAVLLEIEKMRMNGPKSYHPAIIPSVLANAKAAMKAQPYFGLTDRDVRNISALSSQPATLVGAEVYKPHPPVLPWNKEEKKRKRPQKPAPLRGW